MGPILLIEDEPISKYAEPILRTKEYGTLLALTTYFLYPGGYSLNNSIDKEINRAFPTKACKCGIKFHPKRSSHYLCEECFEKSKIKS